MEPAAPAAATPPTAEGADAGAPARGALGARLAALGAAPRVALVAGGIAVALASVGATAYAFWPTPEPAATQKPKKAKKAKRPTAAASSASPVSAAASARAASPPSSLPAAGPASAAGQWPAAASASGAGGTAPGAAASASGAGRTAAPAHALPATAATPHAAAEAEAEAPMERLQRRLVDALGPGGALEAEGGEFRLTAPPTEAASRRRAPAAAPRSPSRAASGMPAARAARAPQAAPAWSYDGPAGPQAWASLDRANARCASGQRQSPIDLRDGFRVDLEPVRFDYRPSAFSVIDDGHTVRVDVPRGNAIEVSGQRYELQQFHFHRPSEERIAGRQSAMSVHLVHRDGEGRVAIVAVQLERGAAQPVVQAVWNNLPLEKGQPQAATAPVDLQRLLPAERGYFTYMGSLTTPPCSEGVLWLVMKQPVPVSAEQEALFARLYPMNARPVQAAAGRIVKESN